MDLVDQNPNVEMTGSNPVGRPSLRSRVAGGYGWHGQQDGGSTPKGAPGAA
jgi:hypothetical protein